MASEPFQIGLSVLYQLLTAYIATHVGEFVLIVLTLLAVVVPILWQSRQNRKEMTCEIVSVESFFEPDLPGVSVSVDGRPVPRAHIFNVRVRNSGKIPIKTDDYEREMRIWFDPCGDRDHVQGRIVSIALAEYSPEQLRPSYSIDSNHQIVISPLLMNRGDYFTIRGLIDGCFNRVPHVDGRIVGVKEIKVPTEFTQSSQKMRFYLVFPAAIFVAGVAAIIYQNALLGLFWMITGYVLFLYLTNRIGRIQRLKRKLRLLG